MNDNDVPALAACDRRAFLLRAIMMSGGLVAVSRSIYAAEHGAATRQGNIEPGNESSVPVSLIGLPYLMGTRAPNSMYGMARGPVVLLESQNVPAALRSYFSDVEVTMIDNVDEPEPPLPRGDQMARILTENLALASAVRNARARGRLPIASIGTCSATLGMVGGLADVKGDFGMIWFDAHGDSETPDTTQSGFIEGMVVPMIAGQSWPRYSRRIPGFRTIPDERIISVSLGSTPWPIPADETPPAGTPVHKTEIDRLGLEATLGKALDQLAGRCRKVFVHMDADTIDPSFYKNFKSRPDITGLAPAQVSKAFDMIAARFEILALDVGAFDPTVDPRAPKILTSLLLDGAKAAARSRSTVK